MPVTITAHAVDSKGAAANTSATATQASSTNILARVPFIASSGWNTPVPSNATYTTINWPASTGYNYSVAWPAGGPGIYLASASDPALAVTYPAGWGYPGGTINTRLASGITSATGSDHEILILDIDGDTIHNFWEFNRTDDNHASAQAYGKASFTTGTGFGTTSPTFLGAGITAIGSNEWGGLLCQAELNADGAILHALHFVTDGAITLQGFVPPAISSDGAQTAGSGGVIQEGWKFAIPKTTAMPGGLSVLGQQVFTALQNYGAYTTDVAGGVTNLRVNINDFDNTSMTALFHDLNTLVRLTKRVT